MGPSERDLPRLSKGSQGCPGEGQRLGLNLSPHRQFGTREKPKKGNSMGFFSSDAAITWAVGQQPGAASVPQDSPQGPGTWGSHQHGTVSTRRKKRLRSPAAPPTLRATSGRVQHGPSPAGPNLSVPCSEEKGDPSSSTFPGRSLEILNGLQKAVARSVFSDYSPAGWEWISAETATALLRTMPLASPRAPENLAGIS